MNKITFTVSLMLGVLSLTGCRTEIIAPDNGGIEITEQKLTISATAVRAGSNDATRTTMNGDKTTGFHTAWDSVGDKLGVYTYSPDAPSGALTVNAQFDITSISDGIATFEGNIRHDAADRTYYLYAYYPRQDNVGDSHTRVSLSIATDQTMPANGTHDPSCDIMMAIPRQVTVTGGTIQASALDDLEFRYLVGFMNLNIKDIISDVISATDVVKSVKITAQSSSNITQLTGEGFGLNLTTGTYGIGGYAENGWNYVYVKPPAGTTLGELDLWAAVNTFIADRLTFAITTETHTIEKVVAAEQLGGTLTLRAGDVKTFNMSIDGNCSITEITGPPKDIRLVKGSFLYDYIYNYGPDTHDLLLSFDDISAGAYGTDRNGFVMNLEVITGYMNMDPSIKSLDLPNGMYNFDNSHTVGTVALAQDYTNIVKVDAGKYTDKYLITGGSMVVQGDHTNYYLIFDITLLSGDNVHAEYRGPLSIPNPAYLSPAEDIDLGTLTNFMQMEHQTHYVGEIEVDEWLIAAGSEGVFLEYGNFAGSGWTFMTRIYAAPNSGEPLLGIYEINDTYAPGSAQRGQSNFTGTWITRYNNSSIVKEDDFQITSGTITSAWSGNAYTITIDAYALNGSHITGTLRGALTE